MDRLRGMALALVAAILICGPAPAGEVVRLEPSAAALDRNGDGFADVLVDGRTATFDLDGDGRFDYALTLAFKEYETAGHARYIDGGYDRDVFAELTREGLDKLCASERVAADWTAVHFADFGYYRDGYGRLAILDGAPENDGRLASKASRPGLAYVVAFNPDGTVQSVTSGGRSVALATFDYDANRSSGTLLTLPPIDGAEALERIRAALAALFAGPGREAPDR